VSKNSYLTVTDQFCGAGGSSQGARNAGLEVKMAMNHWKLAIETHNTNFPDTLHDCTDVSACDPRRYYYGNHQVSKVTDPIGTVNTRDRSYVINYQKPKIEDCYYRMIKVPEVKLSMAFDSDYIVLGSGKDQVKQCGNAVTPPVQEWIIRQCANSLEV